MIKTLLHQRKGIVASLLCICLVVGVSQFMADDKSDIRTVPVSGVVTLNGKPVANVGVSFEPIYEFSSHRNSGLQPGSTGFTDADGRYKLKWCHGIGAIPGRHRVTLVWRDPDRSDSDIEPEPVTTQTDEDVPLESQPTFLLPLAARDCSQQFIVPDSGTAAADFEF